VVGRVIRREELDGVDPRKFAERGVGAINTSGLIRPGKEKFMIREAKLCNSGGHGGPHFQVDPLDDEAQEHKGPEPGI